MKDPATLMHSIRQRLLAHFEKSAPFAPEDPATEAAPADSGQLLYAPVSGRIRALTRIKDPVFSSEVLGKGCAIEPSCGEVVAPADGIVKKIAKTHHAISLLCDNGLEVLIHVGMDTVELKGKGYELFVQAGRSCAEGTAAFPVRSASHRSGRLHADYSDDRDQQQPVCTDRAFALRPGNCRAAAVTR